MSIVLASLAVASVFLTIAVTDFENRAVVTTIETTTASLRVRKVNFTLIKGRGWHLEGGLSLDSRSADNKQKVVTSEKSKACVTTFAKKVGAQTPVTQNQKWSYFP